MLSNKQSHANSPKWAVDYKNDVNKTYYPHPTQKKYGRFIQRQTTCSGGAPNSLVPSSYFNGVYNGGHLTSINSEQPLVSTRWNPTPEQVMTLQEMYERGVRTPSSDEIQLITAKLSQFGKIEGKNVFYWFQNHKARERQKKRRQIDTFNSLDPLKHDKDFDALEAKETGLCLKIMKANEKKEPFLAPSNFHVTTKGSASMYRAVETKSRNNGWSHLDERENQLHLQKKTRTKKGSETLLDLSFKPSNLNPISKTSNSDALREQTELCSISLKSLIAKDEDLIKVNIPKRRNNQILQLFPLLGDDPTTLEGDEDEDNEQEFTPKQFYKFL